MKINQTGITRIVIELRNVVIKIPRFTYSWEHFLKGLIANISENKTWEYNSGKYEEGKSYLLCPVVWCSYGGWLLVMKKADMKRHEDEVRAWIDNGQEPMWYVAWKNAGFGGDDKCDNFGYYENRLVKIDY